MTDRIAGRALPSAAAALLTVLTACGEGAPLSQSRPAAAVQSTPEPGPTLTLTASPATVSSGGTVVLTWQSTNATSCSASGAWSGIEPTSGSRTTGALTATSTFTLTCSGAAGTALQTTTVAVAAVASTGSATVSWSPPTEDTDGGPISPLSGYTIYYGTSPSALTQFVPVGDASATSFTVTGLAAGTWYFGVQADALDGTHSALSNIGAKTL